MDILDLSLIHICAKKEDIPLLVKTLGVSDENRLGGFVKLNAEDVTAIYNLAADR